MNNEPSIAAQSRLAVTYRAISDLVPDPRNARTHPVGVCHNQARIHRKALAPDQAGPNTGSDNAFEYAPENAAVTKALIART